MDPFIELRHINRGATAKDNYDSFGIILFDVECPGNAMDVLERSKTVLSMVIQQYQESWPTHEEWLQLLPEWFIKKCAPEPSIEEENLELERWQKLTSEEQSREEYENAWTLSEWVSWFEEGDLSSEIRYWFWWDSMVKHSSLFHVALKVIDVPFPMGSFEWLMRASGATNIRQSNTNWQ